MREQAEHGRTGVHGCSGTEVGQQGRRDVEVLIEQIHVVELSESLDVCSEKLDPLSGCRCLSAARRRRSLSADGGVLGLDACNIFGRQHVLDDEVAVPMEGLELARCQSWRCASFEAKSAIGPVPSSGWVETPDREVRGGYLAAKLQSPSLGVM